MNCEKLFKRYGFPEAGKKYFCKLRCHSNRNKVEYVVLEFGGHPRHVWNYKNRPMPSNWYHEYWIDLDTITKATERYDDIGSKL